MVSLLAAVLNHNNLIETEHQDDICFYTKQVYLQLQKNYPEYGITEEEIERFQKIRKDHAFGPVLAHAPYTMNLASATEKRMNLPVR